MKKYAHLSEYKKNQLIPFLYLAGLSSLKISKELKVGVITIQRVLRQSNIPIATTKMMLRMGHTKYFYNKNFFKSIDTPEQAYWLGFIAGDGCIKEKRGEYFSLIFTLHLSDKSHLQKFKKCIQYTGKVLEYKYGDTKAARLDIASDNLCLDLINLGITPNKSLTITDQVIPKYFQRHFIRGLFDADGSLWFCERKERKTGWKSGWDIAGTKSLVFGVQKILVDNLGITKTKIVKNENIYRVNYRGNQ